MQDCQNENRRPAPGCSARTAGLVGYAPTPLQGPCRSTAPPPPGFCATIHMHTDDALRMLTGAPNKDHLVTHEQQGASGCVRRRGLFVEPARGSGEDPLRTFTKWSSTSISVLCDVDADGADCMDCTVAACEMLGQPRSYAADSQTAADSPQVAGVTQAQAPLGSQPPSTIVISTTKRSSITETAMNGRGS